MLNFPASPTTGQIYSGTNGVTYFWDGTIWVASGSSAGGDVTAVQVGAFTIPVAGSDTPASFNTVVLGNSGGWWNTSTNRYTPPAGRHFMEASITLQAAVAATQVAIVLRKNGVRTTTSYHYGSASNQALIPLTHGETVDANGTDYFDWALNVGSGAAWWSGSFVAYPISGVKGPPGDAGTPLAQNAQTGNYTLVLGDANGHLYHAVAAATATYTIPANASVAYPIGTTLTFCNDSANAVTIAITTDTLVLSPGTTTGSRTLATGGLATALKVTSTRWLINGTGLT